MPWKPRDCMDLAVVPSELMKTALFARSPRISPRSSTLVLGNRAVGGRSGCRRPFLAEVTRDVDGQRLDGNDRRPELERLALVRVGELIPAVVDAPVESDRVAHGIARAHAGMGERYGPEQDRAGEVVVARAPDRLAPRERDEL